MTTERIDIVIREDGSRVVRRSLSDIGGSADQASTATEKLKKSLGGFGNTLVAMGLGVGIMQVLQMSDAYTKFTAQLKLATSSVREYSAAYADVKRIANQSQQGLQETGVLYARIANGTRELGTTQKQVAAITETVNMALKVSGATTVEAASAQLQLSQAFASGTLRGEEFNAVNEAAPRLMKALADGIGVPVGALKKMASEGEITSKVMADVLPKALADLREEAKKVETIGGAFTVLKNNMMEVFALRAQTNGTVGLLTGAIGLLANNLNYLTGALSGLMVYKVAGWFFSGVAGVKAYFAANAELAALVVASKNELIAQAQAIVASTTATAAATAAKLAEAEATLAGLVAQRGSIVAIRETAIASLTQARNTIAQAEAAIAAATAAGAQSFALRTLRMATAELAVAETARAAAMAELAALGRAQAAVTAQIAAATATATAASVANTAATKAQAAAQAGLAGAAGRTAVTASLGARALGLLGGPIGIITTLLTVGATAWMVWGNKGSEAEKAVTSTLAEEIDDYIANLQKQIDKLTERNELAAKKMVPLAPLDTPYDEKRTQIMAEILKIGKDTNTDITIRTALLQQWGAKLNDLDTKQGTVNGKLKEQNQLASSVRLAKYYEENGSAAQKFAGAVKNLKKELMMDDLPADVMKGLKEKYFAGQDKKDDSVAAANAKATADVTIAQVRAGLEREKNMRDEFMSDMLEKQRQGVVGEVQVFDARIQAVDANTAAFISSKNKELEALSNMRFKNHAEEVKNAGDIQAILEEQVEAERSANERKRQMRDAFNFDRDKPQRDAEDTTAKEIRAIDDQRDAIERQIKTYGMGAKALNAYTISELEAEKAALSGFEGNEKVIAGLNKKIAAYKSLGAAQVELEKLNKNSGVAQAKMLLDALTAIDEAAKSAAQGMAASFGKVGESIGSLTTSLTGYARTQAAIALQQKTLLEEANKDGDQTKIAKINADAQRQSAQAQIKSFGDMAGAAKGFFKENSAGYKALQAAEKTFRAFEMAMALQAMVKKIFFKETEVAANVGLNATKLSTEATTTAASTALAGTEASAWGITAVVKAMASMPFPANLAAGAATLAAVVAIGARMTGGGVSAGGMSAADQQKVQGTGSVFGDKDAKSGSIDNTLAILEKNSGSLIPINQGMLSALRSIQSSLGGLANLVVRNGGIANGSNLGIATGQTSTGMGGLGGKLSSLGKDVPIYGWIANALSKAWGSTNKSIVDSGIRFGGSVNDLQGGKGYEQYASVDTTKKSWFGLKKSTTNSVETAGLDSSFTNQFAMVFKNMEQVLTESAVTMQAPAESVRKTLEGVKIEMTNISLKGLSGNELTEALNAVVSKALDQMAGAVFPEMEQFRQVGEGYAETVIRLANNYAELDASLTSIGGTFGATGIASLGARESLIALMGGVDSMKEQTSTFAENFLTEAERLAPVAASVASRMGELGLAGVTTRDQFKEAVTGLVTSGALTTEAGRATYAGLMSVAGAFAEVHPELAKTGVAAMSAKDILEQGRKLQERLNEATMTSAQLQAELRKEIAGVNQELYDSVIVAEAAKTALNKKTELEKTYIEQIDAQLRLQMDAAGQRALDIRGMEDSTIAMYDRLAALKKENETAQKLKDINKGYQDQIDEMVKSMVDAGTARQIETRNMDASTLALYERLEALKQEKTALENMKAVFANLASVFGASLGIAEAAAKDAMDAVKASVDADKQDARKVYDDIIKDLDKKEKDLRSANDAEVKKIKDAQSAAKTSYELASKALNDERKKAVDSYKDAVNVVKTAQKLANDQYKAAVKELTAEKNEAVKVYNAAIKVMQDQIKAATENVQKLSRLAQSLSGALDKMRIAGSEGTYRNNAQDQIASALATAKAGGGLPDADVIASALTTLAQPSEALFATFEEYQRDFFRAAINIRDLSKIADEQLYKAETELSVLESLREQAQTQHEELMLKFDTQREALDAANELQNIAFDKQLEAMSAAQDALVESLDRRREVLDTGYESATKGLEDQLANLSDTLKMQLEDIQRERESAGSALEAKLGVLDEIYATAVKDYETQLGIFKAVSPLADAIKDLVAALSKLNVAQTNSTAPAGTVSGTQADQFANKILGKITNAGGYNTIQSQNATMIATFAPSLAEIARANQLYIQVLGRNAEGNSAAAVAAMMKNGMSEQTVINELRGSFEYEARQISVDLQKQVNRIVNSVLNNGVNTDALFAGVAGHATGGTHPGGLRIVGEHGPELEATGASRIWTANQTASMMRGGDGNSAAIERLAMAVEEMGRSQEMTNAQMANIQKRQLQLNEKWDAEGMPSTRDE